MKLSLKNIGKIKEGIVEINGITIIAGVNNTGKSTVGKTLYSIFNSFYNIESQIKKERVQIVENLLDMMYRNSTNRLTSRVDTFDIAENIIDNINNYLSQPEMLKNEIMNSIIQYDENFEKVLANENDIINETIKRIMETINVSSEEIFKTVLNKKLDSEFNGQINNIFSDDKGTIELQIKDYIVKINLVDNNVTDITNKVDLKTEAIYIDDPFVLDEARVIPYLMRFKNYPDHKSHLKSKLISKNDNNVINEIIATKKFDNIYSKINLVCGGDVVNSRRTGLGYKRTNTEKILDIRNLSTGLKTFVVLKTLLVNGVIEFNGTIILDEPEIHLHPEWQLLFAELIVLIQKEFGMHVLLNTHSPYFLRAIEIYSAKHGIADKCKYYLSVLKEDDAYIQDVSDDIESIYQKLSAPFQALENERWSDD